MDDTGINCEPKKVYAEQHLVPPNVLFPLFFLISSLSPRSVCSCIRISAPVSNTLALIHPAIHTVVIPLRSLSLHNVLPQKLRHFIRMRNRLLELLAAGLQVSIALEVLAHLDPRGGEDVQIS